MLNLLLKEPVGQIVAYNILATRENNLISEKLLKKFLSHCLAAFTEESVTETRDLISQFGDVARGKRPVSGSKNNFLLACKRSTSSVSVSSVVCNVIELGTLKRNIFKDSSTMSGHGFIPSGLDPTNPNIKYVIERINKTTDKYRPSAKLGGNPKCPLLWITPSIEKERRKKTSVNCADYIRDRLGLIDRGKNQILVEIKIPGKILVAHESGRPTIFDAVSHSRFRVSPDTRKAIKRSAWGCTVDLEKFANKNMKIDGLAERIVKPIDCTGKANLKFEYIGCTSFTRGKSDKDNDLAFAKRFENSIYLDTLKQEILDMF